MGLSLHRILSVINCLLYEREYMYLQSTKPKRQARLNRRTVNLKSINIGPFEGFQNFILRVLYTLVTHKDIC